MEKPRSGPGFGKSPEIAAADWLLENPPQAEAKPPAAGLAPATPETFALADDSGDLAPPVEAARTAPTSPGGPRAGTAPVPESLAARGGLHRATPVEQVWSRAAEWGPTLAILVGWIVALLFLLYVSLGAELYALATGLFFGGGLVALFLSYPILITLERPVRITPEQAARDFYGSLSHHFPHYRRMWLLLSATGRTSPQFATYEGFKRYWVNRLGQIRDGHAGAFSPLAFSVEEFRSDKSSSRTEIEGSFRLRVHVRGRRNEGPILNLPITTTFARGPDNMWYLDDGRLADRPRATSQSD